MKNPNSLLKKVIILFIIVLTPLTSFSAWYLHSQNVKQKEHQLSGIKTTNDTYIGHLGTDLKQIYIANLNILEQDILRGLSVMYNSFSPYEKSMWINLLRDQLSNIASTNPLLKSTHAYLFDHNLVLNSAGYKFGSYQTLSEKENTFYHNMTSNQGLIQYYINPETGKYELSVFLAPPTSSRPYAVSMVISQQELKKYMDDNISFPGELYFFRLENGFSLSNIPNTNTLETRNFVFRHEFTKKAAYEEVTLDGTPYVAFASTTSYSGGTYIRLIPTAALMPTIQYSYFLMFALFVLIITACLIFFAGIYRMVHRPLIKLTEAFDQVEQGNFHVRILPAESNDFAYLFNAFNDMAEKLEQLIEKDYNQKLLLQKAEMKQLQAQINPHFLYNSFFMLQRMIRFDPDVAQEVASALASCFRYITKNSMDNVTLREEYENVTNYSYIQGLRFEGRIRIELEPLPEQFHKIPVPKLILQPILENAFKYGLTNKLADGYIHMSFLTDTEHLIIRIEDNGDELTDETLKYLTQQLTATAISSSGIEMSGILNIQRRLNIFSNYKDSLKVRRSDLGGLCVEITLRTNL